MTLAKLRLWSVIVLLLAWLGYLGYQALSVGRIPVVSHAQLLVSTLDVIADVRADDDGKALAKVFVHSVRWPADREAMTGHEIDVANLADASGFDGAGRYILPLVAADAGSYRVAGLPRSPGFDRLTPVYFIYPDTPVTRRQLEAFPKPAAEAPAAPD